MEPEQAFAELGVAPPVTAEVLRRAYLKKVKASGPERDADAFRRIREAYDLLKDMPWLWNEEFRVLVGRAAPKDGPPSELQREPIDLTNAESSSPDITAQASSPSASRSEPAVESDTPDVETEPMTASRTLVESQSGVEQGPVQVSGDEAQFMLLRQRVIRSAGLKECEAVREAWPDYLSQRSKVSNPRMLNNTVEEFRASLLTTCPELADLPVSP